jgi:hypothetical protein
MGIQRLDRNGLEELQRRDVIFIAQTRHLAVARYDLEARNRLCYGHPSTRKRYEHRGDYNHPGS